MKLETDDPIKSQLLRKVAQQEDDLKSELHHVSDRTKQVVTNALIVGGALALTYLLVRGASRKKGKGKGKHKSQKHHAPVVAEEEYEAPPSMAASLLSEIGTSIANQATVFLLDLAKEKLAEFIIAQTEKKKDEHP